MQYQNLTVIGTSHIAKESIEEVRKHILENKPDIVALELDKGRLHALLSDDKRKPGLKEMMRIGVKGWLFSLIGAWVEEKLGSTVGIKPGSEMVAAVRCAAETGAAIALIDQDIEITLKRFSKAFSWKERFRIVVDMFNGIFFRKREIKRLGLENFDLTKVPPDKLIQKMMKEVKHRYPNFYKVLVTERNEYMADKLARFMHNNKEKRILAIVGAGHEKEMIELVKKDLKKRDDSVFSYTVSGY